MRRIQRARMVMVAAVGAIVMLTSYAFTASNTVPSTAAGDGSGTITGFTVSNVDYALNGTTPANIDTVTFDLDSDPGASSTIQIKLESAGSTWYTCSNVTTAVTCDTTSPQATVSAADELRVLVVS